MKNTHLTNQFIVVDESLRPVYSSHDIDDCFKKAESYTLSGGKVYHILTNVAEIGHTKVATAQSFVAPKKQKREVVRVG